MQEFKLSNDRVLKVEQYSCVESPRTWCNLSKMFFIGKYNHLGDSHQFHGTHECFEDHQEYIAKKLDVAIIVPVYAHIHSGITISLEPFNCPWDSGELGWAIVTKEDIRKEYGIKRVTKKYIDKAMNVLEGEIKTLDQYVSGEVYGFVIEDKDGEKEDSCWGFFGSKIEDNGILDYVSDEDRALVLEQV